MGYVLGGKQLNSIGHASTDFDPSIDWMAPRSSTRIVVEQHRLGHLVPLHVYFMGIRLGSTLSDGGGTN